MGVLNYTPNSEEMLKSECEEVEMQLLTYMGEEVGMTISWGRNHT